jgi:2-(1,2-epoxy-1,2-dihydrophenyl)acetyl-CoA isomerase
VTRSYAGAEGLDVVLSHGVLSIVFSRPERRNALDDTMVAALIAALEGAGQDESVRAVVLRGSGGHFCAGFDILGRNTDADDRPRPRVGSIQRRLPAQAHRLVPLMCDVQVPIVCEVDGWAVGIGLHLTLAADFAVVADDARLWEPFMQRGFTPDSGGTWLLPRRVGQTRAREILLLGRVVSGVEAAAWGMVHRAVPSAQLRSVVDDLVGDLAAGPTVAFGLTKWLMHTASSRGLTEHLADEAYALELSSRSEDFREGMAAFADRRAPQFRGR